MLIWIKQLFCWHKYEAKQVRHGVRGVSGFTEFGFRFLNDETQVVFICDKCKKLKTRYYKGLLDRSLFE